MRPIQDQRAYVTLWSVARAGCGYRVRRVHALNQLSVLPITRSPLIRRRADPGTPIIQEGKGRRGIMGNNAGGLWVTGLAGSRGARDAGRQNVATPAGLRVA